MRMFGVRSIAFVSLGLSLAACSETPDTSLIPNDGLIRIDPSENEVLITADNSIMWNGRTVSEAQLSTLLRQTRALSPEPELLFQPDVASSYEVSAKVLRIVKESGATKFGFVGNEQYVTRGTPAD